MSARRTFVINILPQGEEAWFFIACGFSVWAMASCSARYAEASERASTVKVTDNAIINVSKEARHD